MFLKWILSLFFIVPVIAQASGDLALFHQNYELLQNSNQQIVIVDKSLKKRPDFTNYIKDISRLVLDPNVGSYLVASCPAAAYDQHDAGKMWKWFKKWAELKFDVQAVDDFLKNKNLKVYSSKVDQDIEKYMKVYDYAVVANLSQPDYFFKQDLWLSLIDQIWEEALELIPNSDVARFMSFVGAEYQKLIEKKRQTSQYMLMYFLDTYSAQELGLTAEQHRRAKSSFYDAHLSLGSLSFSGIKKTYKARKTSKKIKKNFSGYGVQEWDKRLKSIEKRVQSSEHQNVFSDLDFKNSLVAEANSNFGSLLVNYGGERFYGESLPSVGYDKSCTDYVYQKRRHFFLVRLAIDLVPIPYFERGVKLIFKKWYKTLNYKPRVNYDAFLYLNFLKNGDQAAAQDVRKQMFFISH